MATGDCLLHALAGYAAIPLDMVLGCPTDRSVGVLMYHRVAPAAPGRTPPTWNVRPERFRAQLAGLLRRGFVPWPLRRLLAAQERQEPVPPRTFVVTFDDGYANNYHWAFPILRELNVPATIFVATAYLDRQEPFPFDDWPLAGSADVPAETWLPLSTDQGRELLASGLVDLGAHTHSHPRLGEDRAATSAEILLSLRALRERFGLCDAAFAFPYGVVPESFDAAFFAQLRREGLLAALTTREELVRPATPPFQWGRFTARDVDTAATLAAKLDGHYTRLRDAVQVCRGAIRPR